MQALGVVAHQQVAVLVGLALRRPGARTAPRRRDPRPASTSSFGRPAGLAFRCSVSSISVSVRWNCGTDEFVETTIPSATRVAQAGSGRGEPSTPTTHIRQPPYGSSLSSWQSVGTKTSWRASAWTSSSPSGAETSRPSSVKDYGAGLTVASDPLTERRDQLGPVLEDAPHRERRGLAETADRGLRHRLEPLVDLRAGHRRAALAAAPRRRGAARGCRSGTACTSGTTPRRRSASSRTSRRSTG